MQKYTCLDEETLEQLVAQVLAPEMPPEVLRRRVMRQTRLAWDRQHASRPTLLQRWFGQPALRLAWSAAAFLFIALLAAVFLPSGGESLAGTALGDSGLALGALAFLVAGGALVWLWGRKGR